MPELTRLFTALYKDGTEFVQSSDDTLPDHDGRRKWNPSSFSAIDHDRLMAFLIKDQSGDVLAGVNLISGHVFRSSTDISVLESRGIDHLDVDHNFDKLKLIYYRQMKVISVDGVTRSPEIERYCIGYEGIDQSTDEKVKLILGIDP